MTTDTPHIPDMHSYEEIGEFWDTHSLADYWNQTEPAEFEISPTAQRRYLALKGNKRSSSHYDYDK